MNSVKYINPEGIEVEVPEADAPHFDEIGWERVGQSEQTPKAKKRNTDNNNTK